MNYDIFISYRRENGSQMARLLCTNLEDRGYKCFLDVEELKAGHFDEALLRNIESSASFILVLSPGCLDRCQNEEDWLRLEIAHALRLNKKIVPVMLSGFHFPPAEELPEELRDLDRHNAISYSNEFFKPMMEKLCGYLGQPMKKQIGQVWKPIVRALGLFAVLAAIFYGSWIYRSRPSQGDMVYIPAGEFMMGSPVGVGDDWEHPAHKVYVSAFYIDKYPVTNQDFQKFVKETGYVTDAEKYGGGEVWSLGFSDWEMTPKANWKDPQCDGKGILSILNDPVVQVDWNDATSYAQWIGKRLPTEAEYEKAIRGGTTTAFFWGETDTQAGDYGWFAGNSSQLCHPVGMKKPNPYGLYDIVGNVVEWCSDWYDEGYYKEAATRNPTGPAAGDFKAIRGGGWNCDAPALRSANRAGVNLANRFAVFGFRCVKTP